VNRASELEALMAKRDADWARNFPGANAAEDFIESVNFSQ